MHENLDPLPPWSVLLGEAEAVIRRITRQMPAPLRERAAEVPVTYERRPGPALLADGLEPDLLGLFVGVAYPHGESGLHDLPAQVLLFLENIWEFAQEEGNSFGEEVRKTYLHEIGHFLGLDESDLWDRDLG